MTSRIRAWWRRATRADQAEAACYGTLSALRELSVTVDDLNRSLLAEPCAYMDCQHDAADHGPDGCVVLFRDYYERRFTAEGDRLPPRLRPCGCPEWREPVRLTPRLPREVIAEAPRPPASP